ncbi:phosphoglycerate transporter protein PgtP [bacterium]|nr:phosphoglycerate transporter protein PgtP [bacterium]
MWFQNLLSKFGNAPAAEKITDPSKIDSEYSYWRMRTFYSMYIGYVFFYFTRKSFTFAMLPLSMELGFTKADLGILGSILYITYGISKFFSGIMSDRSNPRYFMAAGLIVTGFCNIFFGLSSSILFFAIFWGLNGWFQGWGWPPCARLLTHWYEKGERGRWWSLWSTSHNVGGAIIPSLMAFSISIYGWRSAMYAPGVICIIVGFFLINRLRDTPSSLGLPSIEEYKGAVATEEEQAADKLSKKQLLLDVVLRNKYIWILGFAYFFISVVRTVANDWIHIYLVEMKGFKMAAAVTCVTLFEVGGFLGTLAAGLLSDKLFEGRRGPANVIFTLGVFISSLGLWYIPVSAVFFAHMMMFSVGFFVFGPYMLIGMAAAELSHKKAAGAATGFVGWFAYIGAASAGYPFGKIAEDYGWNTFFVVLAVCVLLAFALLSLTWVPKRKKVISAE